MESLCLAGAFDSIAEVNRASLFASLETLLEFAADEQEEKELGQSSFFDSFSADQIKLVTSIDAMFKKEADWPHSKKLTYEKEVVGFYVSGHPMDGWQTICEQWLNWSTEKLKNVAQEKAKAKKAPATAAQPGWGGGWSGGREDSGPMRYRAPKTEIKIGGILSEIREVMTKKGQRMAFGQLEDLKGKIEVIFFPEAYANVQAFLRQATAEALPILLVGEIEFGEEAPKILAKTIESLADAHKGKVQEVIIRLSPSEVSVEQLRELKKELIKHRGKYPVRIEFVDPSFKTHLELPKALGISATPHSVSSINHIFGKESVTLR